MESYLLQLNRTEAGRPRNGLPLPRPMVPVPSPLERVQAKVLAEITDLFDTRVLIVDRNGIVVASTEDNLLGIPLVEVGCLTIERSLRIPFQLDEQVGLVVIEWPAPDKVLIPRMVETLIQLIVDKALLLERLPDQLQFKNRFINDLLRGRLTDEGDILFQANLLGLDLAPPRALILIDAANYLTSGTNGRFKATELYIQNRTQSVIDTVINYFHLPNDTICAYIGDGEIAVLKASDSRNLAQWTDDGEVAAHASDSWADLDALKRAACGLLERLPGEGETAMRIGIGRYHPGLLGPARSYQDARVALSLGRRLHRQDSIYCLDDFGVATFVGVADEQLKMEMAVHILSPLDEEPELVETLVTFFACDCQQSVTAGQLCIHRNTLGYRLDKIASLTGLDPRRFEDAIQIRLSLLLLGLYADMA